MKTKTNARVLAWLVALCMVFAIIPVMPAEYASAAEGNVLKYDFSGLVTQTVTLTPAADSTSGNPGIADTYSYSYPKAAGSAEWALHSVARTNVGNGSAYAQILNNYFRLYAYNTHRYAALNLKIKVDNAGSYVPYVVNKQWNPSKSTFKVSLYKMEANGSFGEVIFTNAAVEATESGMGFKLNEAVSLEANTEYGLQFHLTGGVPASGENNPLVDIYSFTLAEEITEITSTATIPTTMSIGAGVTTKFGVSTDANAEIREVSSNSSDVSVTLNDDGSYTINAVRAGFATITVASDYATKQYNIAVRNAPDSANPIYYYNGMSNETYAIVENSITNMDAFNAATAALTYATTGAKNSSQWKFYTRLMQDRYEGDNSFIMAPDAMKLNSVNANVVAYITAKAPATGWYYIDTDYDYGTDGKAAFTIYIHDGNKGGLQTKAFRKDAKLSEVFDVEKPVYISNAYDICFLYSLEEENLNGGNKYANIYSTALTAATPELEAQSTVPTAYNVGDAAQTVAFKVGAVTPTSVSVTANTNEAAVATAVSGDTVTFTPGVAGTASVTVSATYTYGTYSKTVSKTYDITVTKPATEYEDATGVFGSKYAYVTRNANGTYDVSFIGGINKLEGFKKVGFEVKIGSAAYYLTGENVYSSIVVNGETKEASHYGAEYLFVSTVENLESNRTIKIKPYVVDENDHRVYHEGVELELKI